MINLVYETQKNVWCLTPYIILILLDLFIDVTDSVNPSEVEKHLELGTQYLVKNQLADALSHYHQAVEGNPNNYVSYYKRGTVYFALGKAKNAIGDFDKVLELKPDFTAARISRGTIHLKQASYDLAQLDFYNVLKIDPYNQEANAWIQHIDPAKESLRSAEYHFGNDDHPSAILFLNHCLESSPWAPRLYELRAQIHLARGDDAMAVADFRSATKLQSDNTNGHFKLAQLLYKLGHATDSLKSIRECLKLDPEHRDCFPFYKKIKKVEKFLTEAETALEGKNHAEAIDAALKVLKHEKDETKIIFEAKRLLCSAYSGEERTEEAIATCSEVLETAHETGAYCDRAEAYLQAEMYDDAIRDYRQALEIDGHNERAKEGLNRAENRQKQSERRDYYKILDVKRSASKKEIVKAYRKAAQKWHPDNYQTDEKMRKIAEKKFIDIASAKEVLTDDEKRRQFDNGEDPLDPESGRGGQPNFQQFQGFHGSPFQFRFHFN